VLEADRERFVQTIYELKEIRLCNGAIRGGCFQDVVDPARLSETFIMVPNTINSAACYEERKGAAQ
jgi:hypothetical protein